jgi:hypothetical protein
MMNHDTCAFLRHDSSVLGVGVSGTRAACGATTRLLVTIVAAATACHTPAQAPNEGDDAPLPDSPGPGDSSGQMSGLVRYVGQLSMTTPQPFGGSGYCKYTVTLKDVVIDVALDAMQNLQWMVVDDTMLEALVGSCPFGAQPPNDQGFEYAGTPQPPQPGGTYMPTLTPLGSNHPVETIAVTATPANATTFATTIRWHRTDAADPLNWTVNTSGPVDVTQVSCEVGLEYCLGGSQHGAMYVCIDATHLQLVKQCSMGCAPAPVPPAPPGNEHCN